MLPLLPLFAQAGSEAAAAGPDDPDLTVPIVVIAVCLVIILVTLVLSRRSAERRTRTATAEELDAWQLDGGRLLDQWIGEVEAEVHARRTAPDPALVSRTDDPMGLARGIDECPDAALRARVLEVRAAGLALLAAVRDGDPAGAPALAAEARFEQAKAAAAAHLGSLRVAPAPQ